MKTVNSTSTVVRFLLCWCLLITIGMGYLAWANQPRRLAYVDSVKLLNGYEAMLLARKEYATKSQAWQANIDTLSSNVQRAIKHYEQTAATLSPKERVLSTELIKSKQKELVNYQRAIQTSAQQEDSKSTQLVLNQVNAFLERYGKEHEYDLILVATPSGSIAYAKSGLDLTDEVVKELNKEYVKKN